MRWREHRTNYIYTWSNARDHERNEGVWKRKEENEVMSCVMVCERQMMLWCCSVDGESLALWQMKAENFCALRTDVAEPIRSCQTQAVREVLQLPQIFS
jgi:hypothetical protein